MVKKIEVIASGPSGELKGFALPYSLRGKANLHGATALPYKIQLFGQSAYKRVWLDKKGQFRIGFGTEFWTVKGLPDAK